jgi:predicted AAA+ superfamily ATPase
MIIIQDVNDNHSNFELKYKPRWIVSLLRKATKESAVVVLTGARQVGKSTLLRHESPYTDWRYASLDDYDVLEQAERNPAALWVGTQQIILDEVQKAPKLLSAVKQAVDQKPSRIRFVLSGSANLLLMHRVSESLAGRALYLTLTPMTLGEERERSTPSWLVRLLEGKLPEEASKVAEDPIPLMLRGFLPPLIRLQEAMSFVRWWEGYVATYLERDLRQLSQVESLPDFRRVMEALALRSGQVLNQTEVTRDTAVSQPTIHRYLNLLETTCLLERVPAFASSRTTRLIKSPKVYWLDPGLASYLAGYHDIDSLRSSREVGSIFECLILLHLKALAQLLTPRARIYCWRTVIGREVDFVVEQGRKILAIEAKLTTAPRYGDAENLRKFLREYPEAKAGIIVHAGGDIKYLEERIIALPWTYVAGAY